MIRQIVKDEEILSQKCAPATVEDAAIAQDVVDTLLSLEDAACLSANQIGETKAIIAYLDESNEPQVLYNPVIKRRLQPYRAVEACLSHGEEIKATRYASIEVVFDALIDDALVSRRRRFKDWTAQMILHMVDHCNGKLI